MFRLSLICLVLNIGATVLAEDPKLEWTLRREPQFPQMARIAHIQGEVWIQVELDPEGAIVALRPLSGHPLLVQAATESLRASKFVCQNCDGKNAVFNVFYRFKIDDPPPANRCSDAFGNAVDCEVRAPVPTRKLRSAHCLYLWKCASAITRTAGIPPSAPLTDPQTPQTLVPAAVVRPTTPAPLSQLHP